MPDEPLLTLRELAAQLDLPESTVRYYRDAFLDFVPDHGKMFAPDDPLWGDLVAVRRGESHLFLRYSFSSPAPV